MPGEIPFWIEGEVKIIIAHAGEAYVRVPNGNVYLLTPFTPGFNFSDLQIGTKVLIEITTRLTHVYSAIIKK